jgi:hypothetical protein
MPRGRKRRGKTGSGTRGRSSGSGMLTAVRHLQNLHSSLLKQQRELESKIDAIAAAISAVGSTAAASLDLGSAAPRAGRRATGGRAIEGRATGGRAAAGRGAGRRGRAGADKGGSPFRPGSLKEYIMGVLRTAGGKPMAVKDITQGVMDSGFETSNKTLAKSVGIALTQMPGVKKSGRGRFRAV